MRGSHPPRAFGRDAGKTRRSRQPRPRMSLKDSHRERLIYQIYDMAYGKDMPIDVARKSLSSPSTSRPASLMPSGCPGWGARATAKQLPAAVEAPQLLTRMPSRASQSRLHPEPRSSRVLANFRRRCRRRPSSAPSRAGRVFEGAGGGERARQLHHDGQRRLVPASPSAVPSGATRRVPLAGASMRRTRRWRGGGHPPPCPRSAPIGRTAACGFGGADAAASAPPIGGTVDGAAHSWLRMARVARRRARCNDQALGAQGARPRPWWRTMKRRRWNTSRRRWSIRLMQRIAGEGRPLAGRLPGGWGGAVPPTQAADAPAADVEQAPAGDSLDVALTESAPDEEVAAPRVTSHRATRRARRRCCRVRSARGRRAASDGGAAEGQHQRRA